MIRHMLSFSFDDSVGADVRRSVLESLSRFPSQYPSMRNWSLRENVSTRDRTLTHCMSVEFEGEGALREYLESASHEQFVREVWRPVIARQAIVAITLECPSDIGKID